jgi:hypothetical protein
MKYKVSTGIMLLLFLTITLFVAVPMKAQPVVGDPVKIAVVGPQGWIQWDGIWVGAKMAQEKINLGPDGIDGTVDDGIVVGGVNHLIELKAVDSHAVDLNPSAGSAELLSALKWGADFVVGGFRTECVAPMRETFVEYAKNKETTTGYAPLWFIAGASTDELIDCGGYLCGACVRDDYAKYKYVFRVAPINETCRFKQLVAFLKLSVLPKLAEIYGSPVKTYIVAENLAWNEVLGAVLAGRDWPGCQTIVKFGNTLPNPYPTPPDPHAILGIDAEMVGYERTNALTPHFGPVFEDIDAKGARLIIHFFAAWTGVDFIKTWRERITEAVCVGIHEESQMQEFWDTAEGKCEYETFLASVGTATPIVPGLTDLLWYEYKERSDDILSIWYGSPMPSTYPIYTFWGVYDALMSLDESIEEYGSWPIPASKLIPLIEQTDRLGVLGKFKYTGPNPSIDFDLSTPGIQPYPYLDENPTMKGTLHDVYVDNDALTSEWPSGYTRAQIVQWQSGRMEVVWPQDQLYSKSLRLPPWMPGVEYDIAVINVTASPTEVVAGNPVYINATVRNEGNETGTFDVSAYWDDSLIGKSRVTSLVPSEERTIVFSWNTSMVPEGEYTIKAVASTVPGEKETEDNIYVYGPVTVVSPIHITISLSCSTSYFGFKIEINGSLTCDGVGLSGASVLLSYSVTGGASWSDITLAFTTSDGVYSAVWMPPATGNYLVKATWSGNATYPGTTTTINLAVIPFGEQHVFSVESNSTISGLAFNTTDWTLSFTATGPSGTKGYVKVTVAKSLIENIMNIRVYIDGNQTEYTITSTDDSWLLALSYIHSTHQVVVDLDTNIIPEFPSFLILPLFMIATLLAVTVYRRKHSM